jgi:hypothetical protein
MGRKALAGSRTTPLVRQSACATTVAGSWVWVMR